MANYTAKFRTNCFRVNDEEAFKDFMKAAGFTLGNKRLWEDFGEDGIKRFAFGSESGAPDEIIDPCFAIIMEHPEFPAFDTEKGYRDMSGFDGESFLEAHGLEEPDAEDVLPRFYEELRKHVCDGDAAIIIEIGNEKLRSVNADAAIVASDGVTYASFQGILEKMARSALGNGFRFRFSF